MEKQKLEVVLSKTALHYSEIGQNKVVLFSWANREKDKVIQQFPGVKCRDYLGDAIWLDFHEKKGGIFGWKWDPAKNHRDEDCTRLLIQFATEDDFAEKEEALFFKNLPILQEIEIANGFKPTEVIETDQPRMYLLEADARWQQSVFLISLYTFLVKVCVYKYSDQGKWIERLCEESTVEGNYCRKTKDRLPVVLANLGALVKKAKETKTGWKNEKGTDMNTIHNESGFLSIIQRTFPPKPTKKPEKPGPCPSEPPCGDCKASLERWEQAMEIFNQGKNLSEKEKLWPVFETNNEFSQVVYELAKAEAA